jgi:hypothetical protein
MKYKCIRAWLQHNKVLFETVAATLLSGMAIIVSIAQTKTAYEQTRLLSGQTHTTEARSDNCSMRLRLMSITRDGFCV